MMRGWWIYCGVGLASLFWVGCSYTPSGTVTSIAPERARQCRSLNSTASYLAKKYQVSVIENSDTVVVVIPNRRLFMERDGVLLRTGCEHLIGGLVQLINCYPDCAVRVGGCYPDIGCQSQSLMLERSRILEALLLVKGMRNASSSGELNLCMAGTKDSSMLVLYKTVNK